VAISVEVFLSFLKNVSRNPNAIQNPRAMDINTNKGIHQNRPGEKVGCLSSDTSDKAAKIKN
jgi:hypothetical protein